MPQISSPQVELLQVSAEDIKEWKSLGKPHLRLWWRFCVAILVICVLVEVAFLIWFFGWGQDLREQWWPRPQVPPNAYGFFFFGFLGIPIAFGLLAAAWVVSLREQIKIADAYIWEVRRDFLDRRGLRNVPEDQVGLAGEGKLYELYSN